MSSKRFGEELRELRQDAGLSLHELSDHVGVSFAYLSKVERCEKNPPSDDILSKWLDALGAGEQFDRLRQLGKACRKTISVSTFGKSEIATQAFAKVVECYESGAMTDDDWMELMETASGARV